jgi:hypothetical protein
MYYIKQLHKVNPSGLKRTYDNVSYDVHLSVYGIFDTHAVNWTYYICSYIDKGNTLYLTDDIRTTNNSQSYMCVSSITSCGKKVNSSEEGLKFIEEFKMKWETGSNDLLSEVRDKKLNEILK